MEEDDRRREQHPYYYAGYGGGGGGGRASSGYGRRGSSGGGSGRIGGGGDDDGGGGGGGGRRRYSTGGDRAYYYDDRGSGSAMVSAELFALFDLFRVFRGISWCVYLFVGGVQPFFSQCFVHAVVFHPFCLVFFAPLLRCRFLAFHVSCFSCVIYFFFSLLSFFASSPFCYLLSVRCSDGGGTVIARRLWRCGEGD